MPDIAVKHVVTHDMDAHAKALSGWQQDYRQLARGDFTGALTLAQMGEVTLFTEQTNLKLIQRTAQPRHMLALATVAPGAGACLLQGKAVSHDDLMVFDGTAEAEFVCCDQMDLAAVAVPRDDLEQFGPLPWALSSRTTRAVSDADTGPFRRWLQGVVSAVATGCAAAMPEALPLMIAGNCFAVLDRVFDPRDDVRRHLTQPQRFAVVARARDYIDAHLDDNPTIPQVARGAGIGTRFLDQCFSEVLGLGPAAYMRAIRLSAARRDILDDGLNTTLADIAMRRGFWHLGRFSAYYREQFGETPSQTLRRQAPGRAIRRQPL